MVQFLSLEDVLESHAGQIAMYGGSDGIRDLGLLQSALAQPAAMFDGKFLHADAFEMAAAYLFHIVKNHPFVDGNKRVALESALVFLESNGHSVEALDDELVELVLRTIQAKETWRNRKSPHSCELVRSSLAADLRQKSLRPPREYRGGVTLATRSQMLAGGSRGWSTSGNFAAPLVPRGFRGLWQLSKLIRFGQIVRLLRVFA